MAVVINGNFDKKRNKNRKSCEKLLPPQQPIEKIQIYENGNIRELIVPRQGVIVPGIWSKSDYKKLQSHAQVVSPEERAALIEAAQHKKNQLALESEKRKDALLKSRIAQIPQTGSVLNTVENDTKQKTMYLLERSQELMQEQDDRVKIANSVILSTKCRAIRNAQIAEKQLIKKQLHDESQRLDQMMEQRRQEALKKREQQIADEHKKNEQFKGELDEQMRMNEVARLIEAERKDEESKRIKQALAALQQEEQMRIKQRMEQQKRIRDDFHKTNEELLRYRQKQQEEERIADLRIQKFMEKKLEREQQLEKELELKRLEKEREIVRLRNLQQKSLDYQAQMDEMNMLRTQEEVEREWRRKELEMARKKKETLDNLKRERQKQIDDLRKMAAINLARDEAAFQKVIEVQNELHMKDVKKKQETFERNLKHRNDLLKQISEKEKQRINEIENKFSEGEHQRLEQRNKDKQIEKYIKKKVNKLRDFQIMDNYIHDIEKTLQISKSYN